VLVTAVCVLGVGQISGCREEDKADTALNDYRNEAVTSVALRQLVDDLMMVSEESGTMQEHDSAELDGRRELPLDNQALLRYCEMMGIPIPYGLQVHDEMLHDAWGRRLHVLAVDGGWAVGSCGPDGVWDEGEGDDIVVSGVVGSS